MNKMEQLQELLAKIPKGYVTTYKELAHGMGTRGYRYIGQLLHNNPKPDEFPCYKVIQSNGHLGGFALGKAEKIKRLRADGLFVKEDKVVDFASKIHRF